MKQTLLGLFAGLVACLALTQPASATAKPMSVRSRDAAIRAHCAPGHHSQSAICQARVACIADSRSAECDRYCNLNPIDRVCDLGFTSSSNYPDYPDTESPYPWARSGSYCDQYQYSMPCYGSGISPWQP